MKTKELKAGIIKDIEPEFVLVVVETWVLSDKEECKSIMDWAIGQFNCPYDTIMLTDNSQSSVVGSSPHHQDHARDLLLKNRQLLSNLKNYVT